MRTVEYRNILKPSVEYLEHCGVLMLDTCGMAEFLGVPQKVVSQLVGADRIPLPCHLGISKCSRPCPGPLDDGAGTASANRCMLGIPSGKVKNAWRILDGGTDI